VLFAVYKTAEAEDPGVGREWLRREVPNYWDRRVAILAHGAAVPYPPGWQRTKSDRGTASAVTFDGRGRVIGYLNLTPRQDGETLRNWARFRVEHNADEHEQDVQELAAATRLSRQKEPRAHKA